MDATGKVTAIAPGTATITATTEDGGARFWAISCWVAESSSCLYSLLLLIKPHSASYRASYSGNILTLRFHNVPTMETARIVIDPGHSGPDNGAAGNLAAYPEKVINQQIAKRLYNVLKNSYGSNVYIWLYSLLLLMKPTSARVEV